TEGRPVLGPGSRSSTWSVTSDRVNARSWLRLSESEVAACRQAERLVPRHPYLASPYSHESPASVRDHMPEIPYPATWILGGPFPNPYSGSSLIQRSPIRAIAGDL